MSGNDGGGWLLDIDTQPATTFTLGGSDGSSDPYFPGRRCHQTTGPCFDGFGPKETRDPLLQGDATRLRKPDQQQTVVSPWRVLAGIREIQVLRHQEPSVALCRAPHDIVVLSSDVFGQYSIDVVSEGCQERHEPSRQVLVKLDPHRTCAAPTGKSS